MKVKLKIGQSFDVVEWLGSGRYCSEYIGCQGLIDPSDKDFMFANSYNGLICIDDNEVKPIGKLTITKIK